MSCVVTLTVIFNFFNFDARLNIQPQDLALLVRVAIISHARFTRQSIPPPARLQSFVEELLFKHKISNQHQISRKLLLDWVFQVTEIKNWLQKFQDPRSNQVVTLVPNQLVQGFKAFRLLKYRVQDSLCLYHRIYDKADQVLQFYNQKNQKFLMNRLKLPTLQTKQYNLQKSRSGTLRLVQLNQKQQRLKRSKSLAHNVITVRGKTITKKSVLDIRRYFETLSDGKEFINLQDFNKITETNSLLHPIAISIFKYLSGPRKAAISFRDFLLKVEPKIGRQNLRLIESWLAEYYQIKSPQSYKKLQLKKKKKKLPTHDRNLLIKLFQSFDQDKKGFVAAADFVKVFKYLYNPKEIEQLVRKHNKGGTLNHKQFAAMFLPDEYQF